MDITIGSARINDKNDIYGGEPGDNKQTGNPDYNGEVSMQKFYTSKDRKWLIFRPKDAKDANAIADKMITACNNKNVGYGQDGRLQIINNGVSTNKATECDCSSLVRACIKEGTGKDPGNFTTSNAPTVLKKSGLFNKKQTYISDLKTPLYTGDVLLTSPNGHAAIVTNGNSR